MKDAMTILDVRAAMKKIPCLSHPAPAGYLWYEDPEVNAALAFGVEKGWILRPSLTQVEYTEAGIRELREVKKARVLTPETIYDTYVPMTAYGCFVMVDKEGNLYCAPMMEDGSIEHNDGDINAGDLTDPGDREFVDAMNAALMTRFRLEDFSGR